MSIYGVINSKGKEVLFARAWGSAMSTIDEIDVGNIYATRIATSFPWAFEEKPTSGFIFLANRAGAKIIISKNQLDWFDWHEENQLPQLIQHSFELLAVELKSRYAYEWRRQSEALFDMFLELNTKEEANDFPLTKALLLDYEAIDYWAWATPVFKMQTAREALKSFKGVSNG